MRKFKIALWTVVILFLGLIIFQNLESLGALIALKLNLSIAGNYESPDLPAGIWVLAALLLGFFVAYFGNLAARFRAYRTIKGLRAKLEAMTPPDLKPPAAMPAPEEDEAPVS